MRLRTLLAFALAALVGAAVAVLPALAAAPSEVTLEVNENCVENNWPCWTDSSGANPAPALKITIATGGEVKFSDHAKAATVSWTGSAPTCSGIPASAMTGWEGSCKFEQPGTYNFESSTLFNGGGSENYTKYEIVVGTVTTSTTSTTSSTSSTSSTSTTSSTTTTTPTTTTSTTTTPATTSTQTTSVASTATTSGPVEEVPPPSGESHPVATLALAKAQHGNTVHGTVQIPAADEGARLEVELLAHGASVAKVKRSSSSRVGRFVRTSAPAGKVSFTVPLNAAGKSALRHHHKLVLTVKIVLTPKHGTALTLTHSLTLR